MQSAFEAVIWIVCALGIVLGIAGLVLSSKPWEEFGKNHLVMDRDLATGPRAGSTAAVVERDEEIRQMLEARNARRARRGEAALDIEGELRKLTAPQIDEELRAEIRDMVVARNHRRARAGKPPLDVSAEIDRQISELGAL